MGEGGDLFDTSQGSWTGWADMGWGDDEFRGSATGDTVTGGRGADVLAGNGGDDLMLGGTGDDVIEGGAGNDGLYGESGNDRITTLEGDRAFGGDGDDRMVAGDLRFASIDGGSGFDTLQMAGASLRLDLSAAIATGRLTSIEAIALADGQQVAVRAGDAGQLASGTLELDGGPNAGVTLVGGWIEGAATTRHGASFRSFALAGETIYVQSGVAVTTSAVAPAGFAGLDSVGGGAAAPVEGSRPGGTASAATFAVSNYSPAPNAPFVITADETLQSTGSPVLYGTSDQAAVTSFGAIRASTTTNLISAVGGSYFGQFNNYGTISAIATGNAYAYGFHPDTRSLLANSGRIEAIADAGAATAAWVLQIKTDPAVVFENSGTIVARSNGAAAVGAGLGIRTTLGGVNAVNSGVISASGGAGTIGAQLFDGTYLRNTGTIEAVNSAASGARDATGMLLYATFSSNIIENSGLISGTTWGIRSAGGVSQITNSGHILGGISLSDANDRIVNTGEIRGEISLGGGADEYRGSEATNAVTVHGGAGNDIISAGVFNDTLDGGAGDDQLGGGKGDDIYYVDSQNDVIYEATGEGIDSVLASGSFYLWANVDNLTLVAGTAAQFGVGNELANIITGNGGDNLLIGHQGNDTIAGAGGADWIYGEEDNDALYGGAGIDYLIGGAGNDVLHGEDGDGEQDHLYGGTGDDSYYVDAPNDFTYENAGEGTDTVYANIAGGTYYLFANVENLTLQGTTLYGVGNELDNRITGSDAANWLLGGAGNDRIDGGRGNDVLYGEAGADTFVFGANSGIDTIGDFAAGTDKIDLSAYGFASFAAVQAAMTDQGGGIMNIALGNGNFVILTGVAKAQLSAGDFILSASAAAPAKADVMAPEQEGNGSSADPLIDLPQKAGPAQAGPAHFSYADSDAQAWVDPLYRPFEKLVPVDTHALHLA
jgi:Ca2+-binding RTX toxin-like protein